MERFKDGFDSKPKIPESVGDIDNRYKENIETSRNSEYKILLDDIRAFLPIEREIDYKNSGMRKSAILEHIKKRDEFNKKVEQTLISILNTFNGNRFRGISFEHHKKMIYSKRNKEGELIHLVIEVGPHINVYIDSNEVSGEFIEREIIATFKINQQEIFVNTDILKE